MIISYSPGLKVKMVKDKNLASLLDIHQAMLEVALSTLNSYKAMIIVWPRAQLCFCTASPVLMHCEGT